jgi:hypothetical protein
VDLHVYAERATYLERAAHVEESFPQSRRAKCKRVIL